MTVYEYCIALDLHPPLETGFRFLVFVCVCLDRVGLKKMGGGREQGGGSSQLQETLIRFTPKYQLLLVIAR